eukprot:403336481
MNSQKIQKRSISTKLESIKSGHQQMKNNIVLEDQQEFNSSQITGLNQSENQIFQKVLNIIKKYEVDPQKFNRVRFEMFREDKQETNEIPSNVFKTIYKRLGIKTNINDEKDIFQLLQLNASNQNNFNLVYLNKLVEIFAKQLYKQKSEEGRIVYSQGMQTFVSNNNFTWKPKQSLNIDVFFDQVQGKLRRAFQNSHDAYRFFNISMRNVDFIDEQEFSTLYGDAKVTDYMALSSKVQQMMRGEESDIRKNNNFAKLPLDNDEIMDYPHFFKLKKNNLQLNQNKLNYFKTIRTRRTLSIASGKSSNKSKMTTITPMFSQTPQNLFHSEILMKRESLNRSATQTQNHSTLSQIGVGFLSTRQAQIKDGVMNEIIQNHYMNEFVQRRRDEDRENYLNDKLMSQKPVFKNFLDNNANILRREKQILKMKQFKEKEKTEEDIQYNLKLS